MFDKEIKKNNEYASRIDLTDKKIRKTYICQGKKVNCDKSQRKHYCAAEGFTTHSLLITYEGKDLTEITEETKIRKISLLGKCDPALELVR